MSVDLRRTAPRVLLALVIVLGGALIWANPASAHVDFLNSDPADESVVAEPVTELRFEFSGEIAAVPEQTFVLDSDGAPLEIADVTVVDDTTLLVTPAEPLAGGRFGAQWAVAADDTHSRTGAITFEVTDPAVQGPPEQGPTTTPGSTVPPEQSTPDNPEGDELDSALAAASSDSGTDLGQLLGALGRFVAYGGIILAVGALAFVVWAFEGSRDEADGIATLATTGAILTIAGTIVEAAGLSATLGDNTLSAAVDPSAWSNLTDTDAWIGFLLRVAGGLVIAATARSFGSRGSRFTLSPAAWFGALMLLASGAFIGHTASTSPRALVAVSDFAHLAAGSVWAGGAVALALTLRARMRAGSSTGAAVLVARFSVSATWALALVAVTGVGMAWAILPEPSALWSSAFGWILIVKVGLVVAISALGAYNHFVLVPEIRSEGRHHSARIRLLRTLSAEVLLFVAVIAATAALVGSSPT